MKLTRDTDIENTFEWINFTKTALISYKRIPINIYPLTSRFEIFCKQNYSRNCRLKDATGQVCNMTSSTSSHQISQSAIQ